MPDQESCEFAASAWRRLSFLFRKLGLMFYNQGWIRAPFGWRLPQRCGRDPVSPFARKLPKAARAFWRALSGWRWPSPTAPTLCRIAFAPATFAPPPARSFRWWDPPARLVQIPPKPRRVGHAPSRPWQQRNEPSNESGARWPHPRQCVRLRDQALLRAARVRSPAVRPSDWRILRWEPRRARRRLRAQGCPRRP